MPCEQRPILLSHPHAGYVANRVAALLEEHRLLFSYVTGVAYPSERRFLFQVLANFFGVVSNRQIQVPSTRLDANWLHEWRSRAFGLRSDRYDRLFVRHDELAAHRVFRDKPQIVYAFEDGAKRTFEAARRVGAVTVYDLPSPYFREVSAILTREAEKWRVPLPRPEPGWKQSRKLEEIKQADAIIVASSFTRASVVEHAGDACVNVVPYGFPVEEFSVRDRPPNDRFTVLSVGSHSLRKGTQYLLEAWKRSNLRDAKLLLVGPLALPTSLLEGYRGLYEHLPHVPRQQLAAIYKTSDVLAFPTLCDGFGLVIQEAMSCGTPVVTTPSGGGPECIEHGENGWIVPPGSVDHLVDFLRHANTNRDELFRVGLKARRRAETYPWVAAGELLVSALTPVLSMARS